MGREKKTYFHTLEFKKDDAKQILSLVFRVCLLTISIAKKRHNLTPISPQEAFENGKYYQKTNIWRFGDQSMSDRVEKKQKGKLKGVGYTESGKEAVLKLFTVADQVEVNL